MALACAWLTGCQQQLPVSPAASMAERNFNAVWDASVEVLRSYRFTLDRMDKRAGVITTLPLTSAQWFELWRHDAVTPTDVAESSLHTIYRQVTVTIRRRDGATTAPAAGSAAAPEYVANVEIQVARSDRPNPPVTSTADAYEMFLRPMRRTEKEGERAAARPLDRLGRDPALEKILLDKINLAASR